MARPKVPQRSTAEKVGGAVGGSMGATIGKLGLKGTLAEMGKGSDGTGIHPFKGAGAALRKANSSVDNVINKVMDKTGLSHFGEESPDDYIKRDKAEKQKAQGISWEGNVSPDDAEKRLSGDSGGKMGKLADVFFKKQMGGR